MNFIKTGIIFITIFTCSVSAFANNKLEQEAAVKNVIVAMNRAISNGDVDELLTLFADGAIRADLFSAHDYRKKSHHGEEHHKTAGQQKKHHTPVDGADKHKVASSSLSERWQAIVPVLHTRSHSYERSAEKISVYIDGALATAWVNIKTKRISLKEKAVTKENTFIEVLILKRGHNGWKISVITNNRSDKS